MIVVGYDGTEADAPALLRARALGLPLLVVTTAPGRAAERLSAAGGADVVLVRRVRCVSPELVFDTADRENALVTVLSDYSHNATSQLRPAMLTATRVLGRRARALSCLLVVRHGNDARRPYRDVLVGADATVSSCIAALAAAYVARTCGASLSVSVIERRRDLAQRELIDRMIRSDPDFDVESYRHPGPEPLPRPNLVRDLFRAEGVAADFEFRVGDPSDVLVRASRYGSHDLLVSAMMGVSAHGRQGHVGRVTRRLLRLSPVDHLVVFDPVGLGSASLSDAPGLLAAATAELLGERAPLPIRASGRPTLVPAPVDAAAEAAATSGRVPAQEHSDS